MTDIEEERRSVNVDDGNNDNKDAVADCCKDFVEGAVNDESEAAPAMDDRPIELLSADAADAADAADVNGFSIPPVRDELILS